jgi:site-specific recombinase XerD
MEKGEVMQLQQPMYLRVMEIQRTKKMNNRRQQWRHYIRRFCDVWLCANNHSEKTIRAYRTDLVQFSRQLPRSCSILQINRFRIEGWVVRLQKQQYAGTSIRRKLASLRAFFGYLVASNEVMTSPLKDLRIRLDSVKRLTRIVPKRDVRAIVLTVDRQKSRRSLKQLPTKQRLQRLRNALMIRLLCLTGIRVGELVSLQITEVQQDERTLIIHGKGYRERLAFVTDPPTAILLDEYLKIRRALFPDSIALFTNVQGAPLATESVRHILRRLGIIAGASCRVTPHMLRHTAATTLLENGADLRIVQEFLGHGSIRSTERYTHIARGHLLRVLRRTNPLRQIV